jgi:hypothetical protein
LSTDSALPTDATTPEATTPEAAVPDVTFADLRLPAPLQAAVDDLVHSLYVYPMESFLVTDESNAEQYESWGDLDGQEAFEDHLSQEAGDAGEEDPLPGEPLRDRRHRARLLYHPGDYPSLPVGRQVRSQGHGSVGRRAREPGSLQEKPSVPSVEDARDVDDPDRRPQAVTEVRRDV